MSPIRRRTFFGKTNNNQLRSLASDRIWSDNRVQRALQGYIEDGLTPEIAEQDARIREMSMAAEAELKRRLEREAAGKEKMERDRRRV